MVMPTESIEEVVQEQAIDAPETETSVSETQEATDNVVSEAPEGVPSGDAPVVTDVAPSQPQPVQQPVQQPVAQADEQTQQAIRELQQRKVEDEKRQWEATVVKKARSYERQLNDAGYMPEQSRDQANRYIQQERKFQKQEKETSEMLRYVEGRQLAALYFMKEVGLADQQFVDDITALQKTTSPDAMKQEAQRIKRERALLSENARLKQSRVAPQTFDNSQGAAEVTTNEDKNLEAYIKGDRSTAAVAAARRLTLGM